MHALSTQVEPVVHQHGVVLFPLNLLHVSVLVPVYAEQADVGSVHPGIPGLKVTHPYL